MTGVRCSQDSTKISILGHGLILGSDYEVAPGALLTPSLPKHDLDKIAQGCRSIMEYSAILGMADIANFSIEISGEKGTALASKAWNSLWMFHLFSLAARTPCISLYSVCNGAAPRFAVANRQYLISPVPEVVSIATGDLQWAVQYISAFNSLVQDATFSRSMRCLGNAHHLPDLDMRIMLLWSGIEGLLSVDAELSRRIALYASIMLDGRAEERVARFKDVKRAYVMRSKVVHGNAPRRADLERAYTWARYLLTDLLRRCVELGRVPSPDELDEIAVSNGVSQALRS